MKSSSFPIVLLALVIAWCALHHEPKTPPPSPTTTTTTTTAVPPPPGAPDPLPTDTITFPSSPTPSCPPPSEPEVRSVATRSGETSDSACRRHGRVCAAVKDAVGDGGVTSPMTCSTELHHVREDVFLIGKGKKRGTLPRPVLLWDDLDETSAMVALCVEPPSVVEF